MQFVICYFDIWLCIKLEQELIEYNFQNTVTISSFFISLGSTQSYGSNVECTNVSIPQSESVLVGPNPTETDHGTYVERKLKTN